jgi:hypothetical protein
MRANFTVEPEDESDNSTSHPEFVATQRDTGLVVAVEAKSRNRRRSDRNPTRAGVKDRIEDAARKAPKDKPYAVFVEIAMPSEATDRPAWVDELADDGKDIIAKHGGLPGPFDLLVVTSVPDQHFGIAGEPSQPWTFAEWHPPQTRIPNNMREALRTALRQFGHVPDFEEK